MLVPNFDGFKAARAINISTYISLWDGGEGANTERFQGSSPLLPDLCSLSVPEVGVCGVYLECP